METLAFYLYVVGALLTAFAFAAHVVHAVLLANGRRVAVREATLAAAGAGGGYGGVVTGSFADQADRRREDRAMAMGRTAAGPYAIGFTWAALAALAVSLTIRALIVGRGPWGNMYEFTVAFAVGILAGYVYLERRHPIRSIGFVPVGVAAGLLAYSTTLPHEIRTLVPALQNAPLLTIHVGMAMISYGIFATSFAAGVGYLVQGRGDRYSWLPSHRTLDEVAHRAVIIGFPIFAAMIILGSLWASIAWSRYWGWDPKETSALVTWLIYAIYLHARTQRGWAGRPAALILVVGFFMVLVTYSGNLWFSGLHAYSGLD